jgi:hypothetical protein
MTTNQLIIYALFVVLFIIITYCLIQYAGLSIDSEAVRYLAKNIYLFLQVVADMIKLFKKAKELWENLSPLVLPIVYYFIQ